MITNYVLQPLGVSLLFFDILSAFDYVSMK